MQTEIVGNNGIGNSGQDATFQEGPSLIFYSKFPICLSSHLLAWGLQTLLSSI